MSEPVAVESPQRPLTPDAGATAAQRETAESPTHESAQCRRASSTPSPTRVTTKQPPTHRVVALSAQPPAANSPNGNGNGSGHATLSASEHQTVKRHPQLKRPTTNIRPIDNAKYGNVSGGGAAATASTANGFVAPSASTRRTFPHGPVHPTIPTTTDHHQQQQQHVDPASAAAEASPEEAAVRVTVIPRPARQPVVVVGRPSIAGQRMGRARHPNTAGPAAPAPSPPPPGAPPPAPAAHDAPTTAAARRRHGPVAAAQRNHVAANAATHHGVTRTVAVARAASSSPPGAAESHSKADARPSPITVPNSNGNNSAAIRHASPTAGGGVADLPAMSELTRPSEAYKVGLRPTRQQWLITRNARNPRKIVNCFSTKYTLVRRIAREMDFEIQETEDEFNAYQFNLCWSDTVLPLTKLVRLGNWERSNHFPSMYLLCRKGHLGTTLGRLRRKLPTHFAFYPHTWSMRTEKYAFQRYHNALKQRRLVRYFIMKPNSGCQGRGIIVTRDPLNALEDVDNYIVQEYVHRPLLMEGKKFDLRIYILLTSIREPSIFMFNDGLVRICTEPYEPPTEQNAKNACKHLTNYAVNKHSSEYVFNTNVEHGDVGNKRNFRFLNRWLESEGHSAVKFWEEVGFLIVKTILTAQPQIAQVYNSCFPRYNEGYTCFEVLGFDVLIDAKMKPWLMEVNHTPSLATDTPLDYDIKSKLLREVWDIVDCQASDQQRDRLREQSDFTRRHIPPWATNHPIYGSPLSQSGRSTDPMASTGVSDGADNGDKPSLRSSKVMSPTSLAAASEAGAFHQMVEQRRHHEDTKLKNFARIYPSQNEHYSVVYETIRNLAQTEWSIPDATAGFTINGHEYNRGVTPTFATASGSTLTPAQQQQQDRIRKDLRDIATGNFSATTGTGRTLRGANRVHKPASPVPVGPVSASTNSSPAPADTTASSPTAAARPTSPLPSTPAPPIFTPVAQPAPVLSPASRTAEEYRMIEERLRHTRRRPSDAAALDSEHASAASTVATAPDTAHGKDGAAAGQRREQASPSAAAAAAATLSAGVPSTPASAQSHTENVLSLSSPRHSIRKASGSSTARAGEDRDTAANEAPPEAPNTPPVAHITLIEPTAEELALLDRLQQDLDEDEAADPAPPSEEESFDLRE